MTPTEVVALLTEIELAWPNTPPPEGDQKALVKVWFDWLGRFDYDVARAALRELSDQARPPSCAQVLAGCKRIAGETLPGADAVLAEFARVAREHSTQGPVHGSWWSRPAVALFAASGAWRDWGASPDASANEYLAASQAAALASLRRRWDEFAGDVRTLGLVEASTRLGVTSGETRELPGELRLLGSAVKGIEA